MPNSSVTHPNLGKELFRQTWPLLFGALALMTNHLVDAAWIALLGVEPLAAIGFTLPVQQIITGLQIGLGIATTAIISRSLGANKPQQAIQQGGLILVIGAVALAILSLIIWWARAWLFSFLGAEAELLPILESYWPAWLLSSWLGAVVYLGYSQHRAHKDNRFTGFMMVLVSVLNLVLDPLFIFTFGLGLPGAAWATSAAFLIGAYFTLPRLFKLKRISFQVQQLNLKQEISSLFSFTGPATLSQLMPAASAFLATGLVASFGTQAVAAWGLGSRLESFSLVVVLALTMSLPPLLGRSAGAKDWAHIEALLRIAVKFILLWQLGLALVWFALSQPLVSLLTSEAQVADLVSNYLIKLPFSYMGLGVCILMVSASNALGMPLRALLISFVRLFVCYLPFLWFGAYLGGIYSLFTGALVGNLLTGVLAWQLYRQGLKHLKLQVASAS